MKLSIELVALRSNARVKKLVNPHMRGVFGADINVLARANGKSLKRKFRHGNTVLLT